jgi:hypothetical protein
MMTGRKMLAVFIAALAWWGLAIAAALYIIRGCT